MSDAIGSSLPLSASISLQKTAQDIPKKLIQQLLPQPVQQSSGSDSASFSSEALARLQQDEQQQQQQQANTGGNCAAS